MIAAARSTAGCTAAESLLSPKMPWGPDAIGTSTSPSPSISTSDGGGAGGSGDDGGVDGSGGDGGGGDGAGSCTHTACGDPTSTTVAPVAAVSRGTSAASVATRVDQQRRVGRGTHGRSDEHQAAEAAAPRVFRPLLPRRLRPASGARRCRRAEGLTVVGVDSDEDVGHWL